MPSKWLILLIQSDGLNGITLLFIGLKLICHGNLISNTFQEVFVVKIKTFNCSVRNLILKRYPRALKCPEVDIGSTVLDFKRSPNLAIET